MVLASLAWATAAPAVAADDAIFGEFNRICLATGAHGDAAKAAAASDGFGPATADQLATLQKSLHLEGAQVMVRADGEHLQAVFWGVHPMELAGKTYPTRICTYFVDVAAPESIAAAKAWANVDPLPSHDTNAPGVLMFSGAPGAHASVANLPDDRQAAALAKGQVQILMAGQSDAGHTMFVYGALDGNHAGE